MRVQQGVVTAIGAVVLASTMWAWDRPSPKSTMPMATEQVIWQHATSPIKQSVAPVALALAKQTVFVATDDSTTTQPTQVTLQRLRFKTATDNMGRLWAYAYTSDAELSRAFPQGTGTAELSFRDFFAIVDRETQFAGILLDSGSDASYPIPRELFGTVKEVLQRSVGQ